MNVIPLVSGILASSQLLENLRVLSSSSSTSRFNGAFSLPIVFYSFFRKTILCKKKLLVAKQAVHNDSTNAEKRVVGKLLSYTENLVNKNKTKHQTIEHINKGTKKISKHKKKSSAYHGGMSNNFSQYCEERTHKVASIVLRFSPKCDGTN